MAQSAPTVKSAPIRMLLAEDNAGDVELEIRELRSAGIHVAHRVAYTEESFIRELEEFKPEVIVSDFSMPSFDGKAALGLSLIHISEPTRQAEISYAVF